MAGWNGEAKQFPLVITFGVRRQAERDAALDLPVKKAQELGVEILEIQGGVGAPLAAALQEGCC